jgi:hypothetical protein
MPEYDSIQHPQQAIEKWNTNDILKPTQIPFWRLSIGLDCPTRTLSSKTAGIGGSEVFHRATDQVV